MHAAAGAQKSRSREIKRSPSGAGAECGVLDAVAQCEACPDLLAPQLLGVLQPEHGSTDAPTNLESVKMWFALDTVADSVMVEQLQAGYGELQLWKAADNTLAAGLSVASADLIIENSNTRIAVTAKLDVQLAPKTEYYVTMPSSALSDQPGEDQPNYFVGFSLPDGSGLPWGFTTGGARSLLEVDTATKKAGRKSCKWIGPSAGDDNWCNNNCNHVPAFCPATSCNCNVQPPPPPPPRPPILSNSNPRHLAQNIAQTINQIVVFFNQKVTMVAGKAITLRTIGPAYRAGKWKEEPRTIVKLLTGSTQVELQAPGALVMQIPKNELPLSENTRFCVELTDSVVKSDAQKLPWTGKSSMDLYGKSVGCKGLTFSTGLHAPFVTRTIPVHHDHKVDIKAQYLDLWMDHAVQLDRCTPRHSSTEKYSNLLQVSAGRKSCKWIGASAGNDNWCNSNCNHVPAFCPSGFCKCGAAPVHQHAFISLMRVPHLAFTQTVAIA